MCAERKKIFILGSCIVTFVFLIHAALTIIHFKHMHDLSERYTQYSQKVIYEFFNIKASVFLIEREIFDLMRTTYDNEGNHSVIENSQRQIAKSLETLHELAKTDTQFTHTVETLESYWQRWSKVVEKIDKLAAAQNFDEAGLILDESVPTLNNTFDEILNLSLGFAHDHMQIATSFIYQQIEHVFKVLLFTSALFLGIMLLFFMFVVRKGF